MLATRASEAVETASAAPVRGHIWTTHDSVKPFLQLYYKIFAEVVEGPFYAEFHNVRVKLSERQPAATPSMASPADRSRRDDKPHYVKAGCLHT